MREPFSSSSWTRGLLLPARHKERHPRDDAPAPPFPPPPVLLPRHSPHVARADATESRQRCVRLGGQGLRLVMVLLGKLSCLPKQKKKPISRAAGLMHLLDRLRFLLAGAERSLLSPFFHLCQQRRPCLAPVKKRCSRCSSPLLWSFESFPNCARRAVLSLIAGAHFYLRPREPIQHLKTTFCPTVCPTERRQWSQSRLSQTRLTLVAWRRIWRRMRCERKRKRKRKAEDLYF